MSFYRTAYLQKNLVAMEKEAVHRFTFISNPSTRVFIDKMEDYNHTEQICFDDKKIYLVADETA